MNITQSIQQHPEMGGLTMGRAKGGNDPTFGCRARSLALVVPALFCAEGES